MGIADSLLGSSSPSASPLPLPPPSEFKLLNAQPLPTFPATPCGCGCPLFWRSVFSPEWRCLNCLPYPNRASVREVREVTGDAESQAESDLSDVQVIDYRVPAGEFTLYTRKVGEKNIANAIAWLTQDWGTPRPGMPRRKPASEVDEQLLQR